VSVHALRDIFEAPTQIFKDAIGLGILGVKAPAGHEQIKPSIVVQVHKTTAPTIPLSTQVEQSRTRTAVVKNSISLIQKYFIGLVLESRHDDVRSTIPINVAKIRPHARDIAPISVVCHASVDADFFEALCAVTQQQIASVVVGYENSGMAIARKIRHCQSHTLAQ